MRTGDFKLVGRDDLIKEIWSDLAHHSLLLIDAPRRMGKTSIMREMADHPPAHIIAYWLDLEDVKSAHEFYRRLYARTKPLLGRSTRAFTSAKRLAGGLSEFQIGPLKIPAIEPFGWKSLLDSLFTALKGLEGKRVVLFLDELPLMLHSIVHQRSAGEASDILNVLRRVTDEGDGKITLVFAGSLGIHHVLRLIRKKAGTNPPMINTSHVCSIPPLDPSAGTNLAKVLLEKSGVKHEPDVPAAISQLTSGIPFYTRGVALAMKPKADAWTQAEVVNLLASKLASHEDLLHIDNDHFGRLANSDYYEEEYRDHVFGLLNLIAATQDGGASRQDVAEWAKKSGISIAQSDDLLARLGRDHLLDASAADGRLRFRYEIVRKSWTAHHTAPGP